MPKKSLLTGAGKSYLRGKKTSVSKRSLMPVYKEPTPPNVMVNGKTLNIPESAIYRALEKMHVNFSSQVELGGGQGAIGGSMIDFVLWDRRLVLEFQGFAHKTAQGKAKDFTRRVRREQAGFMVVYLFDKDLINIHRRLAQIMGSPGAASIGSGGRRL